MIQRVQTIWLFFAAIAGFLTTEIPLYIGWVGATVEKKFVATQSLLLFAVTIIAALLAFIAIFLFRNRSSQMKFTIVGLVVSIALIILEVWQVGTFEQSNAVTKGSYYWGALLPIAMAIFFILAAINIRKDNKLIKSLDRLR